MRKKFAAIIPMLIIGINGSMVSAYSSECTHPLITKEIANFYSQKSGYRMSVGDIEQLARGSEHEDQPPRWINHFYDPAYERGWSDDGGVLKFFGVPPLPSPEWALSSEAQSARFFFDGDYSWTAGIEKTKTGDASGALYVLGHILHLLGDLTVPAHTRNDTHVITIQEDESGIEIIKGDPLEAWLEDDCGKGNLFLAKAESATAVDVADLKVTMRQVALQVQNNFFSADTVKVPQYPKPVIVREITETPVEGKEYQYGLGIDDEGKEYRLVKISKVGYFIKRTVYKIDYACVRDTWERTSKLAVLYGVGLIDFFFRSVEAAKKGCGTDKGRIEGCPCVSSPETCNGIDDDCDGEVDENWKTGLASDIGKPCEVGRGECRRSGVFACTPDGLATVCDAEYVSGTPEVCDGLDNDCNGFDDDYCLCQTARPYPNCLCHECDISCPNSGDKCLVVGFNPDGSIIHTCEYGYGCYFCGSRPGTEGRVCVNCMNCLGICVEFCLNPAYVFCSDYCPP